MASGILCRQGLHTRFNGHPPLGVNATCVGLVLAETGIPISFQWAPTLGGECYERARAVKAFEARKRFQWAPTLGGECYHLNAAESRNAHGYGFNGHPPLGVNATLEKPSLFSKSL